MVAVAVLGAVYVAESQLPGDGSYLLDALIGDESRAVPVRYAVHACRNRQGLERLYAYLSRGDTTRAASHAVAFSCVALPEGTRVVVEARRSAFARIRRSNTAERLWVEAAAVP